jgi:hypothetical protein
VYCSSADVDALQVPVVGPRDALHFAFGLRQRDIQNRLALGRAFEEKLQGERRLAGARRPLDQVEPPRRQTAAEHIVEAVDPAADQFGIRTAICGLR